ncbi:hypothetical protein Acr_00g0068710 [Actinidia rufa]|uniref:Uncharacterized protein n=1 Tax=Actinidia rufa TaxID=165716 RepID=A0A7J0DQT9_9ERIC|nr:hypothetical protein Acr_00g0068710 [Actinidia rufa]
MVLEMAISRISSPSSLHLPSLMTIFLSLISSSIGLQIQPQPEMGRTGITPSVVTGPPRDGGMTVVPSVPFWLSLYHENSMVLAQSPLSSSPSTPMT